MIAILDDRGLIDEVLSTSMCLVEQILIAWSLTAVIDYPGDLTALTPIQFFLEQEKASAHFASTIELHQNLSKSFKLAQADAEMIGKKWTREYHPQRNQRLKFSEEHLRNLK